ncbi:MAG TPA: hypothetical protein VI796_06720 [Candidatus Thermoplasmatota archaeon]|nr:hypothetical protein [Candidatus Thermoplasmatota archaeon]
MLSMNREGLIRPFVAGDACQPDRNGKILPNAEDLPKEYHKWLSWYNDDFAPRIKKSASFAPPIAEMSRQNPTRRTPAIRVLTRPRGEPEGETFEYLISHEVLRLLSSTGSPRMLVLEKLTSEAKDWLTKNRMLAGDIRFLELLEDGTTRPLEV